MAIQTPFIPEDPHGSPSTTPRKRLKQPIWVRASGKRLNRIKKARAYLRKPAWMPGKMDERHAALFIIACNLRLYLQLPINLAVSMINEHYNPRCMDADGVPFPFTDDEIRAEYQRAGLPGMYPTLGVSDPKAKRKEALLALHKEIRRFARKHLASDGVCSPASVWQAFIAFRGGVTIKQVHFGREFAKITGIRRTTPFGVPTYRGVHLVETIMKSRKAA